MSERIPATKSANTLIPLTVVVIAAGAVVLAIAAIRQAQFSQYTWLVMVGLALMVAPMSNVYIPGIKAKVTVGDIVTFTCAPLFGPSAAIIAATAEAAVTSLRITKSPRKFLYNVATSAVSMGIAAFGTGALFPLFGVKGAQWPAAQAVAAMGVFTVCYFFVSTFLIAAYIAVSNRESVFFTWKDNFLWTSISYGGSGASALAAFFLVGQFGYYVFVIPVGLMLMVFFFYRSYFQKIESANLKVEKMEELNFRTIETLIASISAVGYANKMNVRRVERLAFELGKAAGCSPDVLKALRLAAVLHDVGNIAISPQILEKPGALTPGEFERVKSHTSVGARMVGSMGFPYPVAEIISHHHERFDGTGYPSRIKGEDIPLAARVLTIVDCYDALTIDRPYRPRFSRSHALEIMKEQSGKAFDPLMLDKFLQLVARADEEAWKAQSEAIEMDELHADLVSQRRIWQVA